MSHAHPDIINWLRANGIDPMVVPVSEVPVVQAISRIECGVQGISITDLAVLARAFRIADPWRLTQPPPCETCLGAPPAGFTCNACGGGAE